MGAGASALFLTAACLGARAGKLELLKQTLASVRRGNFEFSVAGRSKEILIAPF